MSVIVCLLVNGSKISLAYSCNWYLSDDTYKWLMGNLRFDSNLGIYLQSHTPQVQYKDNKIRVKGQCTSVILQDVQQLLINAINTRLLLEEW